jgi:hypothetical protein
LGHIYGALSPTPTKTSLPFGVEETYQNLDKQAGPPDTPQIPNDQPPAAASFSIAEGP